MAALIELKDDRSEKVQYDDSAYPIYIRQGVLSRYPNHAAPSHWHDDIELIAVLDGEMDYNINGEIVTLHKDEGIFVNARQIHFGFSAAMAECYFICILLHPLLLCPSPSYEQDFVLPVIQNGNAPYQLLDPNVDWQRAILEQIRYMARLSGQKTTPLKVQSAFYAIWTLLYENLPRQSQPSTVNSYDLTAVRNMVGFIQKNYLRKITLQEIAASGAVGQSKCCQLFARYFGRTPLTYLTQYRLNKSLDALQNSDMSITEISLSAGFGGASYYSELFHKYFGKSPTEYRKQIRQNARPQG